MPLLRNNEQKVVANGYPDLREHCVQGGFIEKLDVQRLLDSFEDQFDLCNGYRVFKRKVLIAMPILFLVSLRKRGSGHHLDPRTVEVSAEVKCSLNISQTNPVGELSEAHPHELVTAIELNGVPVTHIVVDTLFELVFVKERHNLIEDCFSFVHGLWMAS